MKKRLVLLAGVLALATAALGTYAWAAASADGQTINACAADDGKLRLLTPGTTCKKGETGVTWNTVGPVGPAGPAGPQGPAGASGSAAASPNAVGGTLAITAQKQGAFSPIALTGYSHEIVSPRDLGSGQATGKRQHKPLTITKEIDKSTPLLMRALTTSENLPSVVLGITQGGTQVATVKLTNASLVHYAAHGLGEEWEFVYQKITWTWVDGGITAEDDWSQANVR